MALALLLWLVIAIVYDIRERRVPNWLVLFGGAFALAALATAQPFNIGWSEAGLGAAVGFGFLLPFYATGLMGAGDVKFAGVLGLWVGLSDLIPIWVVASLLAFAHAVLWRKLRDWPIFPRLISMLVGPSRASEPDAPTRRVRIIPYAAYLALAAAVWMVWGRQSS
jgi:prepilin peptidase CpaA